MQEQHFSLPVPDTRAAAPQRSAPDTPRRRAAQNSPSGRRAGSVRAAAPAPDSRNAAPQRRAPAPRKGLRRGGILLAALLLTVLAVQLALHRAPAAEQPAAAPAPGAWVQTDGPYTIAIDSGHGGSDCGAVGLLTETEITGKTAEYLRDLLEQDDNYIPVLTHEYDAFATPAQRREAAEQAGAALLFSIHGNAYEGAQAIGGYEVYVQNNGNPYAAQSYLLGQSVCGLFDNAGHTPQKGSGIFYCHYEMGRYGEYEKQIVAEADEAGCGYTGQSFGVLESQQMPAVLVEQGYLTNAADADAWLSDEGCRAAAQIYYRAICSLFGTRPRES